MISFTMEDWYATVSLASLELQKSCKALLPAIVWQIPDKSYGVQTPFALYGYKVFAIALDADPLAEFEIALYMISKRTTVPLALAEFRQCREAPFPAFVPISPT